MSIHHLKWVFPAQGPLKPRLPSLGARGFSSVAPLPSDCALTTSGWPSHVITSSKLPNSWTASEKGSGLGPDSSRSSANHLTAWCPRSPSRTMLATGWMGMSGGYKNQWSFTASRLAGTAKLVIEKGEDGAGEYDYTCARARQKF